MLAGVRAFFAARGYTEVETPFAVVAPGEEVHLRALRTEARDAYGSTQTLWLHTSPEFTMKRLLVAGAGPIFQLARVWRDGGGKRPAPDRVLDAGVVSAGATICRVDGRNGGVVAGGATAGSAERGVSTRVDAFERLTVAEAFVRYGAGDVLGTAGDAVRLAASAGAILREGEGWEDLFFRLLLERVEPYLGRDRPTFLTHWPVAQAALARRDPADPRVALRFELFVCGMELANAFEELTDPDEQAARFADDRARRHAVGGADWPLDEDFLAALRHGMPPASGIAMGFDRLAMLAAGADRIDQVQWLG